MAAKFSLSSDSDSEPSEEVEGEGGCFPTEQQALPRHTLTLPELRISCKTGVLTDREGKRSIAFILCPLNSTLTSAATSRIRVNSESQASTVSREEELQGNGEDEAGTPTDGAPFRGRSRSAPPALWAAKKYGRQLRRMSDEFDSLLDKGVSGAEAKFKPPLKGVLLKPFASRAGNEEDQQRRHGPTDAPLPQLVELPVQPPGDREREHPPRQPHATH